MLEKLWLLSCSLACTVHLALTPTQKLQVVQTSSTDLILEILKPVSQGVAKLPRSRSICLSSNQEETQSSEDGRDSNSSSPVYVIVPSYRILSSTIKPIRALKEHITFNTSSHQTVTFSKNKEVVATSSTWAAQRPVGLAITSQCCGLSCEVSSEAGNISTTNDW